MEKATAKRRLGASWAFSLALHLMVLFSASLFITDVWVPETPTLDVTLAHPSEPAPLSNTPNAITYTMGAIVADAQGTRHRTLSDTQFEPRDKDYLTQWRQYIESSGTERYHAALKKNPAMKGALTMRVAIHADGTLSGVFIEQSSGSETLDQLAVQIVKEAAPFKPLPADMRKDTDRLDILRTWKFD